jgi:hypothetical protein
MSKSVKKEAVKQSRKASINIEVKPALGQSYVVIDTANKKTLMKVSTSCHRDKNGEMGKQYAKLTGGVLQLCRYEGVSEPYIFAKLGSKGSFVPVTFLVGPHHKRCLGYEGFPTESAMKTALANTKLMQYVWTGESSKDAQASGKTVFELDASGAVVEMGAKAKPAAAKPAAAKPAKAKKVVEVAKASGDVKKPAKKHTWYKVVNGTIKRDRKVKQPEGFFASEKEAKLNRVVAAE